jgi:hypothetical protein
MTIDELRTELQAGVRRIDERFARVDERFARIDERFAGVDQRFAGLDERMTAEGIATRRYIEERIGAEGETTRRGLDVLAEDLRDVIWIIAEATAQNTQGLDDDETRPTRLEKRE